MLVGESPQTPTLQKGADATEKQKIEITKGLLLIDTNHAVFDMQAIQNRRFMFSPQTGELILGKQYRGNALVKSHAEEHGESGAKAPFDSFLRGWVGTGKEYKDGIIHFAPAIAASDVAQFDRAYSTLEMFAQNGANGKTVIRGFGDVWEQPLSDLVPERSEPVNEVFSILIDNRAEAQNGGPHGYWLSLPTTAEQVQAALKEIHISADNPQDFFINGYSCPEDRHLALPYDMVLAADVDELNFLAARLEPLDAAALAELNAALQNPRGGFETIGQIIDYADNTDYFVHIPDVQNTAQLGNYYLNRSGMVDMPEEWKAGIDVSKFGGHIAKQEQGAFTPYGYLVKSGDEWQRVHEGQPVPEEYRVMAYPAPDVLREEAKAQPKQKQEAAAQAVKTPPPQPVTPIILNSQNSADRMKEITDRLETGIQELFESERYKAYLTSMAKFHSYSFNNTLLIAMQGGQLVAGYNKWRDDFHRNVKKGEKAIKILAPAPFKAKKEVPKLDAQGQQVIGKDGKPVTEIQEVQVPAFKIVSVFDVSQTEGEPLPSLGVEELTGGLEQYQDFFKALEQTSPVPIGFEDIPGGSHGYYHLTEKRIAIQEGMSELQTVKTAIHEIAHSKLHALDPEATPAEQAARPDSRTREVQAESVAYAVCQHYGLDTSDYSFGYVAGWSSDKDLKELKASLETIRATAHELITVIDGHLAELQQQRQAQQEQPEAAPVEQAAEQPNPDGVFSKLPPEQQQAMTGEVRAMLQMLIDTDLKTTGEVSQGTKDAIQTQGFTLSKDGTLEKAETRQPQAWNGIDGILNGKPFMPEASPKERANALIDLAEKDGQRLGNGERRLIVEYAEAVDDNNKVIALINRLCEQSYEMQHGHMDDFMKSQIESEIAVARAEQIIAHDPAAEPVVTILWSESPHLKDGQQMPLHEADAVFKSLDEAQRHDREQPDYTGHWYDKTKFRIDFTMQGQPDNYEGRQDFGDGDGSLIEHIQGYHEYYAQDESWKNHVLHYEGPEAWEADKAQREMLLNEFIPYMKQHCTLSRMEQEAQRLLQSGDSLPPEQTAYLTALVDYVKECRPLLNQGQYQLPEPPQLSNFDKSLQDYKEQVQDEIAQEAEAAGMTVEEYAAAGYEAPEQPQETTGQPTKEPAASDYYYSINEGAARRAKEMNSYSDYKPGSATAEYRHYVNNAFEIAQAQKKRVDPMYHEKIDSLLDTYARKLAANMNHSFAIDARVPSILIAGGSNFPVRQKEKQNAARDSNMQEWQYIQGLLDKIRSTGTGGIRQDDPQAIPKLQKKLDGLEKAQETMKAVNAYYRKHGTLDGCPHLSPDNIENLKSDMASSWHYEKKPFQSWELSNNNAEIRRVRQRIESLTRAKETVYVGWEFDGGHVEANREQSRLQVLFEDKPDADARQQLKEHGFRWAPSVGAWQRLLNGNAYYAADRIPGIQPLTGEKPTELQRNSIREQQARMAQEQTEPEYFYRVHANPRSDSRENLYFLQAYIPQEDGKAKVGDVLYIGTPEQCRELLDQLNTGELTQEAVKELYAKEQEQPAQEAAPEQEAAPMPEPTPERETTPEPETTPANDPPEQEKPAEKPLTALQEKAVEIAERYKGLPLKEKIGVIAQTFGCKTGEIHTSPCTGKWRGTSDISIKFDNGASLFIGNHLTPKAKTVKVQTECVDGYLSQYNPEIVQAAKEAALPTLLKREAKDNEIAAQRGLKPYTVLNVELNDGSNENTGGYIGWYYVTLAVDGKICSHLETGLNYDIANGRVSETPTRADYFTAGALKETDVDYVFNNVGFSSHSTLYSLPLSADVLERAEKALAQRREAQAPEAVQTAPIKEDSFSIYQVPPGPEGRDIRYRSYEELQADGLSVDRKNYQLVYTAPLDKDASLDEIYRRFNMEIPADYKGHSLSMGDIVVFRQDGQQTAYYVDEGAEYRRVPEFLQESPIKAAEMTTEQNYNMIDGVLNNAPTMGELEARVKAGEQVSLLDVAEAAKAEAQKPKQAQRSAKTTQRQKKPSIRAQLAAAKEEQKKQPPAREKSKDKEVGGRE